jgi:hypothetical protein
MTARTLARIQALSRLALGAGLLAAPGPLAGAWVGAAADQRPGQTLGIGLGGRDVAIALGTLQALTGRRGARAWLRAGIVADFADLAATLRARHDLPAAAVPATVALAGGSVLLGAYLQAALD